MEETALYMAVEAGRLDILQCLVENGAQVNAEDKVRIDMYSITHL